MKSIIRILTYIFVSPVAVIILILAALLTTFRWAFNKDSWLNEFNYQTDNCLRWKK